MKIKTKTPLAAWCLRRTENSLHRARMQWFYTLACTTQASVLLLAIVDVFFKALAGGGRRRRARERFIRFSAICAQRARLAFMQQKSMAIA